MAAFSTIRHPARFSPISAKTRRAAIERQIEALIDQLDAMDGDADAEDDGTAEPSLGWSLTYASGAGDDCEDTSSEFRGTVSRIRRAR